MMFDDALMPVRPEAPTLLAAAPLPDARLDEELAFIEVANALAVLQPRSPSPIAPASPWTIRSVHYGADLPYVATPPSRHDSRLMVVSALVATLVGLPIAALAISLIY